MEKDNDASKYLFIFQSLTTINKHIHVFPDIFVILNDKMRTL